MGNLELIAIALGLSMDAFVAAVSKGLCLGKVPWRFALVIGLFFGGFQALMPLIGYFLGSQFEESLDAVDHWIIFALLAFIGMNMILESQNIRREEYGSLKLKSILLLSLTTSIDALAVGVTFAFSHIDILTGIAVIGLTTFLTSLGGARLGGAFGSRFQSKAEIAGGILLVLIGIEILFDHLQMPA